MKSYSRDKLIQLIIFTLVVKNKGEGERRVLKREGVFIMGGGLVED